MKENSAVPYVIWQDSFSVFEPHIDAQHRKLLELINSLYMGLTGQIAVSTPKMLDELSAYTEQHFAAEERLFGRTDYHDYEAHVKTHGQMIRKMAELRMHCRAGGKDLSLEALVFLKKWWISHIMKMDQQYAPYILLKGINLEVQ